MVTQLVKLIPKYRFMKENRHASESETKQRYSEYAPNTRINDRQTLRNVIDFEQSDKCGKSLCLV